MLARFDSLVDIAQQLCTRGHALTKRLRERRELCAADAEGGEAGVRQRDVQPGRLGRGRLPASSRSGPAEQLVEREDLLARGGLLDDRRQPGAGAVGVTEAEEQQTLVILVETCQDIALDVAQVDLGIAGRGSTALLI